MALQVLRERIGSSDFFKILRAWARNTGTAAPRPVSSSRCRSGSPGENLGTLFKDWLFTASRPARY